MKYEEYLWQHTFLLCLASGLLGVIVGAAITDGNSSFREWFGASSGWAAATVGVATILVLIRQMKDLRKQTDFVLGNLKPLIFVEENLGTGSPSTVYRLTIENPNIRDLVIVRVAVIAPPEARLVVYGDIAKALIANDEIHRVEQLDEVTNFAEIAAWTDRNQRKSNTRPQYFIITDRTEAYSGTATFRVDYKYKGERDIITRTVNFKEVD